MGRICNIGSAHNGRMMPMGDFEIPNQRLNAIIAAGFDLRRHQSLNLLDVSGELPDADIVNRIQNESSATSRNAEEVASLMRHWLCVRLKECATSVEAHTLAYAAFQEMFVSALQSACKNRLMNYASAACMGRSRIDSELNSKQLYIAQMEWVNVSEDQQYKAAQDFIMATINRQEWAEDDAVGPADVDRFEQKLIAGYKGKCHEAQLAYGGKAEEEIGLARFEGCLAPEHCSTIQIGNRPALEGTVEGSYHMLANDARIGWHPKWDKRAKSFKEKNVHTA